MENILLIGSGGREHALAWKMKQSKILANLYVAPGNVGTSTLAINVDIQINDFESIGEFCLDKKISIIVVGPEAPLVQGIYDFFLENSIYKNITVIGPSQAGAMLEGSKDYCKAFLQRHNIPTARYATFEASQLEDALKYIENHALPIVLKADGLAAGKGVIIAQSKKEAQHELTEMLKGKFGKASHKVVIEEFMEGIEFSVFVLSDGKNYKILPIAKDYKRIGEGDTGLNTGGMGVVSPPPFVSQQLMSEVERTIIVPTIEGLIKDNIIYKGFIYIGLMNTKNNIPKVVEYNCRMGDPETQAVMLRLESDIVALFRAVANNNLDKEEILINDNIAVTVVLSSSGYPEAFETNKVIKNLEQVKDAVVFHASTAFKDGEIVSNGGRVLSVNAIDNTLENALAKANFAADCISYENKYFRRDIGFEFL